MYEKKDYLKILTMKKRQNSPWRNDHATVLINAYSLYFVNLYQVIRRTRLKNKKTGPAKKPKKTRPA